MILLNIAVIVIGMILAARGHKQQEGTALAPLKNDSTEIGTSYKMEGIVKKAGRK